jgi:hypothetical protein
MAMSDPERARTNAWFFKTGPGQYGEDDRFAGLTLTEVHALRRKYRAPGSKVLRSFPDARTSAPGSCQTDSGE